MESQISTVFVVDSDPESRESISALLDNMPVEIESFSSAEEFLHARDANKHGCLVTELRLPGMSGLDLQRATKAWDVPPVTIMLTAYADVPSTVASMQLGAYTLLEKPCCDHRHWDAIRRALLLEQETRQKRRKTARTKAIVASLTSEEQQLIEMIMEGLPNKTVAARLDISVRTVETRRRKLFDKFGTKSVAQLVAAIVEAELNTCRCKQVQIG